MEPERSLEIQIEIDIIVLPKHTVKHENCVWQLNICFKCIEMSSGLPYKDKDFYFAGCKRGYATNGELVNYYDKTCYHCVCVCQLNIQLQCIVISELPDKFKNF